MKNYSIFGISLGLLASVFLIACGDKKSTEATTTNVLPVITELVNSQEQTKDIKLSGNVEGNSTIRLGFLVAGRINQMNVHEGQAVKQGQLIASLDPSSYEIAKELADIQVSQVADEYQRLKLMYDRKSVSESDFNKVDLTLQGAKAQQRLQAKNLADTRLTSPISGILIKRLAEPGEIVSSGMPILVVSDISKIKVMAYIPESQLGLVRIGQDAEVQIAALGEGFKGKVLEVSGMADPTTRAFTIKVEVDNPKNLIRPGMIADVTLASTQTENIISIPVSSVLRTPEGQSYIYVVEGDQAFQRNISLGALVGDKIEVVSGLNDGDKIVVGGQHKLTNGTKVSAQ